MISTKDNLKLKHVDDNDYESVIVRGKTFKIRRAGNAVSERYDKLVAVNDEKKSDDGNSVVLQMSMNRKNIPQCVSLMVLHSWFRVTFFHWFYWRWLHIKYTQEEFAILLEACQKMSDHAFFFRNSLYLETASSLIKKMTRASSLSIAQELSSEEGTTP